MEKNFWPKHAEHICYHCQQATEKALKAILVYNRVVIPKTHDIEQLIGEVKEFVPSIEMDKRTAKTITRFNAATRYPDEDFDLNEADAKFALKHADQTLTMVRDALNIPKKEQSAVLSPMEREREEGIEVGTEKTEKRMVEAYILHHGYGNVSPETLSKTFGFDSNKATRYYDEAVAKIKSDPSLQIKNLENALKNQGKKL